MKITLIYNYWKILRFSETTYIHWRHDYIFTYWICHRIMSQNEDPDHTYSPDQQCLCSVSKCSEILLTNKELEGHSNTKRHNPLHKNPHTYPPACRRHAHPVLCIVETRMSVLRDHSYLFVLSESKVRLWLSVAEGSCFLYVCAVHWGTQRQTLWP